MLVLTRRVNEKILLPTLGIKITITEIHNGKVRVGIDAPDNVPIIREELQLSVRPAPRQRLAPV